MYSNKNKYKNSSKYTIKLALILVFIAVIGLLLLLEKRGIIDLYQKNQTTSQNDPTPVNTVNYDPPTKKEAESGDIKKQEIVEQSATVLPDTAEVIIVDASQYGDKIEVRAFANNIIEDGTCLLTFSKDETSFQETMPANADASSTPCITLTIDRDQFESSGTWNITVKYEGSTATGTATSTLEIL